MLSLGAGILMQPWVPLGKHDRFLHKHSEPCPADEYGGQSRRTISPTLTPFIGEKWGWPVALTVAAGAAFLGSLLWLGVKFDAKK
jgi:hypothetical protein